MHSSEQRIVAAGDSFGSRNKWETTSQTSHRKRKSNSKWQSLISKSQDCKNSSVVESLFHSGRDLSLIPSTHIKQLTATWDLTPSSGLHEHLHSHLIILTQRYIHAHISQKKSILTKIKLLKSTFRDILPLTKPQLVSLPKQCYLQVFGCLRFWEESMF